MTGAGNDNTRQPDIVEFDEALFDDIYTEISEWDRSDDTYDEVVDAKRDLTTAILRHVAAAVRVLTERAEQNRTELVAVQMQRDNWNQCYAEAEARVSAAEAALTAAEHRLRLLAELTYDYTAEGLRIRIDHEAERLAAAVSGPPARKETT